MTDDRGGGAFVAKGGDELCRVRVGQGDKKTTRGLRVEEHVAHVERQVVRELHARAKVVAVPVRAGGDHAHRGHLARTGHHRDARGVDMGREATRLGHLAAMAHEREPGHVGAAVHLKAQLAEELDRTLVERDHGVGRNLEVFFPEHTALVTGRDDPGSERLREHERIALVGAPIGKKTVEFHEPRDRKAELGLVVVDRVAARDDDAGLAALIGASGENLTGDLEPQAIGKAEEVQREDGLAAHRPDVGERVRGRHLAKEIRVVDHRREEVRRSHEPAPVAQVVDVGVVGLVEAHEELLVLEARQVGEHLREVTRGELGRATGGLHELGQLDAGHVHGDSILESE